MTARVVLGLIGAAAAGAAGWLVLDRMAPDRPAAEQPAQPGAAMVAVALPDTLTQEEQIGKLAYDANCAECHGVNAAGRDGTAPPLVHRYYEPGHHGDAAFMRAARFGVQSHHWPFGDMPPVEGLSDADVRAITAYVRGLQKANGIF